MPLPLPPDAQQPYRSTMPGTAPHGYVQALAMEAGRALVAAVPEGWLPAVLIYRVDDKTMDPDGLLNCATYPTPDTGEAQAFTLSACRAALALLDPGGTEERLRLCEAALQSVVAIEQHKRDCPVCDRNLDSKLKVPCMTMAGIISDSIRKRQAVGYC